MWIDVIPRCPLDLYMIFTSSEAETLENPPRLGSQVIWVAQGSDDGADALGQFGGAAPSWAWENT